jgi:hypothetical protein
MYTRQFQEPNNRLHGSQHRHIAADITRLTLHYKQINVERIEAEKCLLEKVASYTNKGSLKLKMRNS